MVCGERPKGSIARRHAYARARDGAGAGRRASRRRPPSKRQDAWKRRETTMGDAGSPAQAAGAAGTVHIIDDDEAVRRALGVLLRCRSIPVETHASGLAFL